MKRLRMLFLLFPSFLFAEKAVCVVPVANLVGEPLSKYSKNVESFYHQLPLNGHPAAVKRIGQLLFNEVVDIIDQNEEEVCISVSSHFYCTQKDKKPRTLYWTHKNNIAPLSYIKNRSLIPDTINFREKNQTSQSITLKKPFFDKKNKRLYSAGTRFVPIEKHPNFIIAEVLSNKLNSSTIAIPYEYLSPINLSDKGKVNLFVNLIREWAHTPDGKIPYAFGGVSYTKNYVKTCEKKFIEENGKKLKTYQNNENEYGPHTGVDCAGLIYRCAQIAQLPLYSKNTSAMNHYLRPLKQSESIENGDIIFYIPGHVMVVTDKDENLVVESQTHSLDYGFVHETEIRNIFSNIRNFNDLKNHHFSKKPTTRIDKKGNPIGERVITILKLTSIFET